MATKRGLLVRTGDNVIVALENVKAGDIVEGQGFPSVKVNGEIRQGHKIAIADIPQGGEVMKYNRPIGSIYGGADVKPGDWIHEHNLRYDYSPGGYSFATSPTPPPQLIEGRTFMGYRRPDGRAATRNKIGVISAVNCSSTAARRAVDTFDRKVLEQYPNVDDLVFVEIDGCGIAMYSPDHQQMSRVCAGMATHPNIAAYIMVDLGCQQGTISEMEKDLVQLGGIGGTNLTYSEPQKLEQLSQTAVPKITIQEVGGTRKTVQAIHSAIAELLPKVDKFQREPIPVSELVLALQCGGSDGFSGITANPVLGAASDLLVAHGGTVVLGETTEIAGAEHSIIESAENPEAAKKLAERLVWWETYFGMFEQIGIHASFNNNPAQGNKDGGITTSPEKALGAVAKAGTTALREVVLYGERIKSKGFVIMDSPGTDWVSVFGQVAGGSNIVAFTSGRGSCYGNSVAPSFKLASNTTMYQRMVEDMDYNAGLVVDPAGPSIEEAGRYVFERLIEIASGKQTASELLGYGAMENQRWKIGPTV